MISLLSKKDIHEVQSIIKKAIVAMEKELIFQWDDIYPDRGTLENDIELSAMYGYSENGILQGIIVLNEVQDPLYQTVDWKINSERNLIIHRLCINPDFQNTGIATALVQFAEKFAGENNYDSIRLDAFAENPYANKLYEKTGFHLCGSITFRKGNFNVYEKTIRATTP